MSYFKNIGSEIPVYDNDEIGFTKPNPGDIIGFHILGETRMLKCMKYKSSSADNYNPHSRCDGCFFDFKRNPDHIDIIMQCPGWKAGSHCTKNDLYFIEA